jgi:hypothetical protein
VCPGVLVRYRACDSPSGNLREGKKIIKIVFAARECLVPLPRTLRDGRAEPCKKHHRQHSLEGAWGGPSHPLRIPVSALSPLSPNATNPRSAGARRGFAIGGFRRGGVQHFSRTRFLFGKTQPDHMLSVRARRAALRGLLADLARLSRQECFELLKASLEHLDLSVLLGTQIAERLNHQGGR